jgi:hypothetical protein
MMNEWPEAEIAQVLREIAFEFTSYFGQFKGLSITTVETSKISDVTHEILLSIAFLTLFRERSTLMILIRK